MSEKIMKLVIDTDDLYENADIEFREFSTEQKEIIAEIQRFSDENDSDDVLLHIHIADKDPAHDISTIYAVVGTGFAECSKCCLGSTEFTFLDDVSFV